ncbi:MAG: hypothetical protein M3065_09130 [Actinomycetota bacterium]|nr:hypothetical protein [Actinomycetota bacterium]
MTERNKDAQPKPGGFTRRSMIAGSATMAVTAVAPAAAGAMGRQEAAAVEIPRPSTPIPADAVVAYVHDAGRGEVTVIQGHVQRTYRDRALVKRLLAAADSSNSSSKEGK